MTGTAPFVVAFLLSAALSVLPPMATAADPRVCPQGPVPDSILHGDLGPAPTGPHTELACLEVTNDRPLDRHGEIAWSGIPLPRDAAIAATDRLILVGPGERRIAAQFQALSRWGDTVESNAPIRWLAVAAPVLVDADATTRYALREYVDPPPPNDPFAAVIESQGDHWRIDTGLATFVIEPDNPALIASIAIAPGGDGVGRETIYRHVPGAGPSLTFDHGTTMLSTAVPGQVVLDPDGFRIEAAGPVQVVISVRGHFSAADGGSLCATAGLAYERFGFSVALTFSRGRRDIGIHYLLRNECSDADGGPWTDQAVTIDRAAWDWPFTDLGDPVPYYAAGGAVQSVAAGSVEVAQRMLPGSGWQRQAEVRIDAVPTETGTAFENPLVALSGPRGLASAQLAWMRYREPQALAVEGDRLSLRFVGDPLVVGEGKGIWNFALLHLAPAAPPADYLAGRRARLALQLERGLVFRAPRVQVNRALLFPSLGGDGPSLFKDAYLGYLNRLHDETVGSGGSPSQWQRAKTFGSQLWPDIQFDPFDFDANATPFDNSGAMNYWNPSGAELLEFLRGGEPRWLWDFALPQSWLQLFSAYLNIGAHEHGNRGGLAVTSGGTGEGQWHRSAFGSDDYNYNAGMHLAYALRPLPLVRDRFAAAGDTLVRRYSIPKADEGLRERFVNQVDITRQVIQHFQALADCAEFSIGPIAGRCHTRLLEVIDELTADNLTAGVMCQGDVPSPTVCDQPQQFMQNALMYAFFQRMYRNYGDSGGDSGGHPGGLRRALVEGPLLYRQQGMASTADGGIDLNGDWAALMRCDLIAEGTRVGACTRLDNGDGTRILDHNRPHTLALLLMADELDPSTGLCEQVKPLLDDPNLPGYWDSVLFNAAGWYKATAQMMQSAVFAVGLYDTCGVPADFCSLDIDGNRVFDGRGDGVLVLRYLVGIRGQALVEDAVDVGGGIRTEADVVDDYLTRCSTLLDVDGNGRTDALTDGLLAARYLLGLRGAALVTGAVDSVAGTRTEAGPIEAYLASFAR